MTSAKPAMGWSGPALWASGVSELRQRGRKACTTWMPVVGLPVGRASVGRTEVYLSFARLGTSRPPQSVQVETRLSQGGGSAASVSTPAMESI